MQIYMSTKDMAHAINYSVSFLKENKNILFFEGTHYFCPTTKSHPNWKVEAMCAWVESNPATQSEEANNLLKKLGVV